MPGLSSAHARSWTSRSYSASRVAILPVYDPLLESRQIRHILVRHEQGAGHAATGYAQAAVKRCSAASISAICSMISPGLESPATFCSSGV
ncbi:thiamine pyrophosphate-binding protein [Nocardia fusca]|uniref:thiamine pyrophosphate-binding protein n=1 Tax=Nocardia fusca TaxID=941183 RepID=UPI003F777977